MIYPKEKQIPVEQILTSGRSSPNVAGNLSRSLRTFPSGIESQRPSLGVLVVEASEHTAEPVLPRGAHWSRTGDVYTAWVM